MSMTIFPNIGRWNKINLIHDPLMSHIRGYFETASFDDRLFIMAPYINTKILSDLIEHLKSKIVIVSTWKPNDLLSGVSDPDLYLFCKENKIPLYINNDIHLKAYSINLESIIITSGNISKRGLMPQGNREVGALIEKLAIPDRLYFETIIQHAILVTDEFYQHLKDWYDLQVLQRTPEIKLEDIVAPNPPKNFLISALPMTRKVEILIEGYCRISSDLSPSDSPEIAACICHDLVNYNIELGLSKEDFLKKLKIQFFTHQFIQKIDEFINPEAYFGRIKQWVQENCTDVPVPSRREITGNIQTTYDWFEKLGDGRYVIDRPNYSQRITKVNTK